MNIKKKLGILLIVIIAVSGLVGYYRVSYAGNLEAVTEGISESIIRFHVRANSDSQEDQEVKLKVKEAVVDYIRPALSESDSLSESRAILEAERDNIRNVAIKTLRDNGFMEDVSVYFEKSYFPVKSYGDVTFPAGYYEAFRVDIGDAEGKNWWCVLYPPLCFVDAVYGVVPEGSKEKLAGVLTDEEYKTVTDRGCKVRLNNKDKVFIKIKGLYTGTMDEEASCDGEEVEVIESQDDEVEVINVGTYSVVNGKEYIRYEEVYDDSQERSSSIIKIDGDSVEVTKKGVVSTKMRFTMGSKNMTYYQTPYGNMSLGIITKSLEIERTEDTISIYLVYGMEVNCEHLSDCDMQITITTRELRIDE